MNRVWRRRPSPGDVQHVARNMRPMDVLEIFKMLPDVNRDQFAALVSARSPQALRSLCFGLDENPFCAAVLEIWQDDSAPWLASVALFATEEFPGVAGGVIRYVRRELIPGLIADGIRRVECRALASYRQTRRFLLACGATEEVVLPDVGPSGEAYVQYAWRHSDFVKG